MPREDEYKSTDAGMINIWRCTTESQTFFLVVLFITINKSYDMIIDYNISSY